MAGSPEFAENVKRFFSRKLVWGLLALVVVAGGAGWAYMNGMLDGLMPGSEAPVAAAVQTPAAHAPAPVAAAPSTEVKAEPASAKGAAAAKAGEKVAARPEAPATQQPGTSAKAASLDGAGAPVVTAVPQPSQAPGAGLAHVDEHLTYQYNALGRRDPFQSLVDGAFVGADVGGDAPPDPGGIKVVGIVWGSTDQFALVEDVRGNSYVLRKGDKVQNGYVESLKRDGIVVTITSENQSQSVEIPLERKGEQNAR